MDFLETRLQVATAAVAAFEAEPSFEKWRAEYRKDGFLSSGSGLIAFGQEHALGQGRWKQVCLTDYGLLMQSMWARALAKVSVRICSSCDFPYLRMLEC